MDNLDIDAARARAAGETYGSFKSQHPHTKSENEQRTAKPRKTKTANHVCPICGKAFAPRNVCQVYCSKACSEEARRVYQRDRYRRLHNVIV